MFWWSDPKRRDRRHKPDWGKQVRRISAAALLSAFALRAAAEEDTEEARLASPVVQIDGQSRSVYYFEEFSKTLKSSNLFDTDNYKRSLLEEVISERLLANEAARRGYNRHRDVQSLRKKVLASMMKTVIEQPIDEMVPSEEALRRYYDEHPEDFHRPDWTRARYLRFETEHSAERTLRKLLAAQTNKSAEPPVNQWIDTGYFRRPTDGKVNDSDISPKLADAAFTLRNNGEIFQTLIRTELGYHILMRTDYRPAIHISFEKAMKRGLSEVFKKALKKKRFEETIASLQKRYPVEINEAALMEVKIDY